MPAYDFTIFSVAYFTAGIVALSASWIARNSQRRNGANELALLLLIAALWTTCGIFESAATTVRNKILWSEIEYLFSTTTPALYLIFTLTLTGKTHLLNRRNMILLFIVPVITILCAFTNEYHHLLWRSFGEISPDTNLMVYYHGPWFFIGYLGYCYALLLIATGVLLHFTFTSESMIKSQGIAMIIALAIPWAGSVIYLTHLNPFPGFDLTRVGFILSGIVVTFAIYNYRLFDLVPVARELLIENMEDGILVLDASNRIQDINPAAARLLDLNRSEITGTSVLEPGTGQSALFQLVLGASPEKPEVITFAKDSATYEIFVQFLKKQRGSRLILLRNISQAIAAKEEIQASMEKYRMIAENTSDIIWTMDDQFQYTYVSPSIQPSRGYTVDEFLALKPEEVFSPESLLKTRQIISDALSRLRSGTFDPAESTVFTLEHRCKDGSYRSGEVHVKPLFDGNGKLQAIHGVTRDVTERIKSEKIAGFRLRLIDFSEENSLHALMIRITDEICGLTDSPVGFFHFIDPDQNNVNLQVWSSDTTGKFCGVEGNKHHYNIDKAGIWVECVRLRKPIIHNDYSSLENKKGLPQGHTGIIRELTIPIIRNNLVVAVLGVGNKPIDYSTHEMELVMSLADTAWDILVHKRASEALARRETLLQATAESVSIILQGEHMEDSLLKALEILGNEVGVDRVYIFENHTQGASTALYMSQRFEWCSYDSTPQINNPELQNLPYSQGFRRWREVLSSGEVIKGIVANFPDSEKPTLESQSIISMLVVPVMMGEQWWGFIGFDDCKTEREWSETEVHLLSAAADSIGAAYIRKRQTDELIIAKEKAEESDRLKSSFLNNMSHEIRSPMNSIAGFAGILKEEDLTAEERNRYVDIINASADQLLGIVNDVLELARLESSTVPMNFVRFSVNTMMNDIESVVVPRAARKQLELKKILDPDSEEPVIEGDKDKIRQVLMALINNSIKFTSTGQIDFGYHLNDNSALFFVKDTGIGIPPALHHKIFDRFYQVEQDHRKKYGGTGLGLSIAKEIVTMMGGSIWVDSEPEHGSTFYFTFPLPAPPVTDITEGNSIDWSVIKDLTILVAEDEPFNFEYLHKLLLNRVKKIIWAQNGAEVIPLARIHEPNLYLMDIKMPVMDGLEATRQIRSENSQVPVIALTAYSRPEDQAAALASGCNAFISKPFRRNELFETMLREIRMFRTGL